MAAGASRGIPVHCFSRGHRMMPTSEHAFILLFLFQVLSFCRNQQMLFPHEQAKLECLKQLSPSCYLLAFTGVISGQAAGQAWTELVQAGRWQVPPLSCSTIFLGSKLPYSCAAMQEESRSMK